MEMPSLGRDAADGLHDVECLAGIAALLEAIEYLLRWFQ
jgi:hypothetical protein